MYTFLRAPRWIAALLVVSVVTTVFIALGRWQLDRHSEVQLDNSIRSTRLAEQPLPLQQMLASVGDSIGSLEYRRATAEGTFRPTEEFLVRNQVENGAAGFHVVTPFQFEGGMILINRGWIPLALDEVPVVDAPPPAGAVTVELILRSSQPRPPVGRVEPDGRLSVVNRIDIDRLKEQVDDLVPVWGQLVEGDEQSLPVPISAPQFDDNGPHLAYAAQWFLFAVITVVGSVFLIRSSASKQSSRNT
jgi:surfeit locus 1 family protein